MSRPPYRGRSPGAAAVAWGKRTARAAPGALAETEAGWLEYVRDYARLHRWLTFHPLRSDGSEPGWPDLALCRPPVLALAELKREGGELEPDQEVWRDALERCTRLEYHLWRPPDRPAVHEVLT